VSKSESDGQPGDREATALARLSTGSPELDTILGGGFPANSINIIMGEPGSGKTILAERLMFANAGGDDRPILFFTTLSEPLAKVVRYLQEFEFFDEAKLTSGAVVYDSFGEDLAAEGVKGLVPKLKEAIKTLSPKIIVIDSFKAIHDLSASIPEMRRMLYEVAGLLTAYETTAFLVGEYDAQMIPTLPEFAIADGIVELARKKQGTRDERYLRVLKLRGSRYQEGLHAFRINERGLEVYPRLTSPEVPTDYVTDRTRVSTGVKGLDQMLRGGVWVGSSTLIQGATGSGKTTLALQFILDGLGRGEPGLYLNFQENPTQLARSIEGLGTKVAEAAARGLHLMYASPVELQIDSILVKLFGIIAERGIKRVAIDAIGDLVHAGGDLSRVLGYLYALSQHFSVRKIASVMTLETNDAGVGPIAGQVSAMSDTILRVAVERFQDRSRRVLQVIKARGTEHDLDARELVITGKGLDVVL
jgi:circadian clock protein KaiC